MEKRAVLSLRDKKEVCISKDQLQLNTANHFSSLWDKPINQKCIGGMLSEKKEW
jgi:hypothetical protein